MKRLLIPLAVIATVGLLWQATSGQSQDAQDEEKPAVQSVMTFLMFEGKAEEAMTLYASVFPDSKIESIKRYGPGEAGPEGSVYQAVFSIRGQQFMCIDSPVAHGFSFTPAISLFVNCQSADEVSEFFGKLSEGGEVMMPLDEYPFAKRFAWVSDKYGVSWQLSFREE